MKKNLSRLIVISGMLIATSATAQWSLTGNAGTTPGTNFIGTTDAKNLQIKTNGTARMTISSAGNVGIGITAPPTAAKLTVVKNNGDGVDVLSNSTGWTGIGIGRTAAEWNLGIANASGNFMNGTNAGDAVIRLNDTTKKIVISPWLTSGPVMVVNRKGVGIGTTTPAEKLTVQTATSSYGFIHTDGTVTVGSYVGGAAGGGWFGTKSNHNLNFFTNNSSAKMTLTTSGNVGIGTTAPADKLTVETLANSYGITHTDGTRIFSTFLGAPGVYIGSKSNHNLHFYTNGGAPQMTLNTAGNVSIGTQTAATGYMLTVNGKIICTELKVQLQPFPDYVFANDYKLKSIDEVEQHIKTYNRLPGMPSACEVEEGGMSVGEMTGKVVEKVEENTLYIIQLSKENKELKEQLKSIQAQLDALKK